MKRLVGLLAAALILHSACAMGDDSGLVGHWTFDKGQAVVQSGVESTSDVTPSVLRPGILSQCVYLDGGSSVKIPHSGALKTPKQITISAWVLPQALQGNSVIYRKEDANSRTMLALQDGGTHLTLGLNIGEKYTEFDSQINPSALMDGKWHLVSGKYDGTQMRTYVDGKQTAIGQELQQMVISGPLDTSGSEPAYVGSSVGTGDFFTGFIDDLRLYNRALSELEMSCLYQAGAAQVRTAAAALLNVAGADLISRNAPASLREQFIPLIPLAIRTADKKPLVFADEGGTLKAVKGDLSAAIETQFDKEHNAMWYQVRLKNSGSTSITGLEIDPWKQRFVVNLPTVIPRVRYITGSQHYDAVYPSRAFQTVDRSFMINDHAKPVDIAGAAAHEYVPMMQFAMQKGEQMSGFTVTFEWSAGWAHHAGYTATSFTGVPPTDFEVSGTMGFGSIVLPPNSELLTPKVHVVFFEGNNWTALENATRKYIADKIAYKTPPKAQTNKVTYDHWFGIHSDFTVEDMLKQSKRAAELGVEYFCLDAGWYGKGAFCASGRGKWDEPDPAKFPKGIPDLQRLSQDVRDRGMGFGLWSYWILKNGGGGPAFDMSKQADVDECVESMRRWIKTYDCTWHRFEMAGSGGLNYMKGYYEIMDRITKEFPDFHFECCAGGGTRFDLGNMRYCTSTWLSDHTANADVCRFNQTGALRFWPSYMLNLSVRVHRNTGDSEATAYNVISRMPGTLSFNGDIAQWSPEATQRVRQLVDKYKGNRHLQSQPVFFPLPQVQKLEDWDAVCFGDGTGEAQLLYVFRIAGAERQFIRIPKAKGEWTLQMSSEENVKIEPVEDGYYVTLPPRACAVWKR